jgi:hypothetical protein
LTILLAGVAPACGRFDGHSEEKKSEAAKRFETVQHAGIVIFEGGQGILPHVDAPTSISKSASYSDRA